ncbi:MAG: chitobiase/beta-hexosaminidase C-terminal domain-containing protein, partial [Actinobacteria bacterium]|nr:chitobiase/beta-hexosaminidase C-terminal domain-containing protein [Actinomycetota bacterium]
LARTLPSLYTLTVVSGTGGGEYAAGTAVAVTADDPPAGQAFSHWTVDPSEADLGVSFDPMLSSTTATMPAHPVTLTANYTTMATVATPTFNPDGGAHVGSSISVTVICDTVGVTIHYTTNGSDPTEASPTVASGGTVSVPVPGTLKAKAWKEGMNPSELKSASYTTAGTVATPAFNPDGGSHAGSSVNVTIICATDGATIRYTTDGKTPTESSSTVASGSSVSVPIPGTLKAKAWKSGLNPSAVKSANYTAAASVATPTFNPAGGAHPGSSVNVVVSCVTAGATIRYTTDGNNPTESSTTVASGSSVSVPIPGTLKAKAWKTGMNPSAVKSANYTAVAPDPDLGPSVRANGERGTVTVSHGQTVAITVTMAAGEYIGINADWWVVAIPSYGQIWYYMNALMEWVEFPANDLFALQP